MLIRAKRGENFSFIRAKRGENFLKYLFRAKRREFFLLIRAKRGEKILLIRAKRGELFFDLAVLFLVQEAADQIVTTGRPAPRAGLAFRRPTGDERAELGGQGLSSIAASKVFA